MWLWLKTTQRPDQLLPHELSAACQQLTKKIKRVCHRWRHISLPDADDVAWLRLTIHHGSGWRGVSAPAFELRLRVPAWAGLQAGHFAPRVNGAVSPCAAVVAGKDSSGARLAWYCSIRRRWRAGEQGA